MKQRITNYNYEVIGETDVLGGPWEWEVGGVKFQTVLVRLKDYPKDTLAVTDVRSGARLGTIVCKAPKTRPHEALQLTSRCITSLIAKHGEHTVADKIARVPSLPE